MDLTGLGLGLGVLVNHLNELVAGHDEIIELAHSRLVHDGSGHLLGSVLHLVCYMFPNWAHPCIMTPGTSVVLSFFGLRTGKEWCL